MKKHDTAKNIEQLKLEIEEWKNKYLRVLADYQNLEKRTIETRENNLKFAARNLIMKLLPVLDVLTHAEKVLQDQGLKLAIKQFNEVLTGEKIEQINSLGKKYDPHTMECVEIVGDTKGDDVIEEVRTGYMMYGQVIRATQVKVGNKN